MPKPYAELRGLLKQRGVTNHTLACWIDRSEVYVSAAINARGSWTQREMYTIMDNLHVPHRKLHLLFPKDGKFAGSIEDPPPTMGEQLASLINTMVKDAVKA